MKCALKRDYLSLPDLILPEELKLTAFLSWKWKHELYFNIFYIRAALHGTNCPSEVQMEQFWGPPLIGLVVAIPGREAVI